AMAVFGIWSAYVKTRMAYYTEKLDVSRQSHTSLNCTIHDLRECARMLRGRPHETLARMNQTMGCHGLTLFSPPRPFLPPSCCNLFSANLLTLFQLRDAKFADKATPLAEYFS